MVSIAALVLGFFFFLLFQLYNLILVLALGLEVLLSWRDDLLPQVQLWKTDFNKEHNKLWVLSELLWNVFSQHWGWLKRSLWSVQRLIPGHIILFTLQLFVPTFPVCAQEHHSSQTFPKSYKGSPHSNWSCFTSGITHLNPRSSSTAAVPTGSKRNDREMAQIKLLRDVSSQMRFTISQDFYWEKGFLLIIVSLIRKINVFGSCISNVPKEGRWGHEWSRCMNVSCHIHVVFV